MIEKDADLAVLLCTYNGGRHLSEQLASIVVPRHIRCTVHASDDGSSDNTPELLESVARSGLPVQLRMRRGPGRGHAVNFLSLLTDPSVDADFFAYCDQDDIWDEDKLERALKALSCFDESTPALYCSRTRSIDVAGNVIGQSPLFSKPPSFSNALLQNIAGGNTMVMNTAARDLLCRAGPVDVVAHDWWTYLLVSGAGGRVIYDVEPSVSYRQHAANIIGANNGARARTRRYKGFLSGRNRRWNAKNIAALESCLPLLTRESREVLSQFKLMRDAGVFKRLTALGHSGIYAQTTSGNMGLWFASLLKKI